MEQNFGKRKKSKLADTAFRKMYILMGESQQNNITVCNKLGNSAGNTNYSGIGQQRRRYKLRYSGIPQNTCRIIAEFYKTLVIQYSTVSGGHKWCGSIYDAVIFSIDANTIIIFYIVNVLLTRSFTCKNAYVTVLLPHLLNTIPKRKWCEHRKTRIYIL